MGGRSKKERIYIILYIIYIYDIYKYIHTADIYIHRYIFIHIQSPYCAPKSNTRLYVHYSSIKLGGKKEVRPSAKMRDKEVL